MKKSYAFVLIFFIHSAISPVYGTESGNDSLRMQRIEEKLAAAAQADSAFYREVDLSVGRISLQEMLRNIAKVSDVNLTVKGVEGVTVSVNFSRARVSDLLYYLCREHGLDVDVVGNIVSVYPLQLPPPPPREIKVSFDRSNNTLGYDLAGDDLVGVAKKIAALSGHNLIVPQKLYEAKVSGFVEAMPFDDAVEALASVNALKAEKNDGGVWTLDEDTDAGGGRQSARRSRYGKDELTVDSLGRITARLTRGNVQEIITELCERQRINYYFLSPLNHETAVFVRDVGFDTLLETLLAGTPSSYYVEEGIYIFGDAGQGGKLTSYRIVPMTCRSVSKVDEMIPSGLKNNVQIQLFPDLNSIIVSGEQKQVSRVANFIGSIDRRVPLITIEIMIVDVKNTDIMEVGLGLGLGAAGTAATSATLSPGVSLSLNSQSVNSLVKSLNGFGAINLGRVTPDFYINLKFLEEAGKLELRSTPKLSTLNGHEASLKSGETQYYKEITNNFIGSQNPTMTENFVWKSTEANLSVKIIPYVSLDNHITLDIEIEQTEFTGRIQEDAPPGTTTRSFKSIIKVENEEMVLLGGIDRNSRERSSRGLPFIARIPVLRWIFGNTKNEKSDHRLNVFIRPTVTY